MKWCFAELRRPYGLQPYGEKILRRIIRACLLWANPLTSLLLVSELNQSICSGPACTGGASEVAGSCRSAVAVDARAIGLMAQQFFLQGRIQIKISILENERDG